MMRALPGLLLLGIVSSLTAQVQVPAVPDAPAPSFDIREEVPWSRSREVVVKPPANMSEESLRLIKASADAGDPDALMRLASMAASDVDAMEFVVRAAGLGNHGAEYELASMYAVGRGTSPDPDKAVFWARKSAEGGNRDAQFALGLTLARSGGKDPVLRDEGIAWLLKAAGGGHRRAALSLATIFAVGEFDVPVDEIRAEGILKPFAEEDDAEFQYALASLYYLGKSFSAKRGEAVIWLERAKQNGHPAAGRILREIKQQDGR